MVSSELSTELLLLIPVNELLGCVFLGLFWNKNSVLPELEFDVSMKRIAEVKTKVVSGRAIVDMFFSVVSSQLA